MTNSLQHITLLYELSTTMLKSFDPLKTSENFIKKLLSRKNLNYGAVWIEKKQEEGKIGYTNLYSMPSINNQGLKELTDLQELFQEGEILERNQSIFDNSHLDGYFAYIKLGKLGFVELFVKSDPKKVSKKALYPLKDVFDQLAVSLESGFSYQNLEKEIQHRKYAEQSLYHNQEKYRRIVDNIQLGLLEVDTKGTIIYANQPFCELVGYSNEEIMGQNASALFLSSEGKGQMAIQNKKRESGKSSVYELQIKTKDKGDKWIVISGAPNYDSEGTLIGSVGIHLDISDQKRMANEYLFQESKLKKLFEVCLDALITINGQGEIEEWNPKAEEIFNYKKEEVLGEKLSKIIIPDSFREAHNDGMDEYHKTKKGPVLNKRIEISALRKGGEEFPIELSIFPIIHDDKSFFTAFVRDITEIKESREAMTSALKKQTELSSLKSQFVSTTSHELRTPLTTISTDMEIMNYFLEGGGEVNIDKFKKILSRVGTNLDRLNHLINNILLVGQLDSQKVPFKPQLTDVKELVEAGILNNYSNRDRPLKFNLKGKPFELSVDKKLFIQILDNLVSNAFKYSEDRDPPELLMDFQEESLMVHVVDHGIGIPEEEHPKMFSTFFRASNVGNVQGSGLGLSIVNDFVKLHNGEISFKSKSNVGTTFTLKFPKK